MYIFHRKMLTLRTYEEFNLGGYVLKVFLSI